jgi:hypothetical protein
MRKCRFRRWVAGTRASRKSRSKIVDRSRRRCLAVRAERHPFGEFHRRLRIGENDLHRAGGGCALSSMMLSIDTVVETGQSSYGKSDTDHATESGSAEAGSGSVGVSGSGLRRGSRRSSSRRRSCQYLCSRASAPAAGSGSSSGGCRWLPGNRYSQTNPHRRPPSPEACVRFRLRGGDRGQSATVRAGAALAVVEALSVHEAGLFPERAPGQISSGGTGLMRAIRTSRPSAEQGSRFPAGAPQRGGEKTRRVPAVLSAQELRRTNRTGREDARRHSSPRWHRLLLITLGQTGNV